MSESAHRELHSGGIPIGWIASLKETLIMAENTARRVAQKGPDYAQDAVEQSKTAATETATAMQDTYRAASKGAVHFNLQLLETAQNNVNAGFGFARQLMQLQS